MSIFSFACNSNLIFFTIFSTEGIRESSQLHHQNERRRKEKKEGKEKEGRKKQKGARSKKKEERKKKQKEGGEKDEKEGKGGERGGKDLSQNFAPKNQNFQTLRGGLMPMNDYTIETKFRSRNDPKMCKTRPKLATFSKM